MTSLGETRSTVKQSRAKKRIITAEDKLITIVITKIALLCLKYYCRDRKYKNYSQAGDGVVNIVGDGLAPREGS